MTRRRTAALLLCLALLVGAAGCGKTPAPGGTSSGAAGGTAAAREISLLYCRADELNPYTAATVYNRELSRLLYDSLIKLDETYTPVACLAESFTAEPGEVRFALKDARFTDGSPVTPEDVVYSFNRARRSDEYGDAFEGARASMAGSEIVITPRRADVNFVNFLDFPVIKSGSDTVSDADNLSAPPVGCGRYVYDRAGERLTSNPDWHGGAVNIPVIHLVDTPDKAAEDHRLETGGVDFFFSELLGGEPPRLDGTGAEVILNKLVYIGVNGADSRLRDPRVRHAVSSAISREGLLAAAYHSDARVALSPYHPLWGAAAEYLYIDSVENIDIALANLAEAGYNKKTGAGVAVNSAGERLSFEMLVPSSDPERVAAAGFIAEELAAVGISLTVTELPFERFEERLQAGNFELFLGETAIPRNMDIAYFTTPGGSLAYGVTERGKTAGGGSSAVSSGSAASDMTYAEALAEYKAGDASLFDVVSLFNAEMPVIPICFKRGLAVSAADFAVPPAVTPSDCYSGIERAAFKAK